MRSGADHQRELDEQAGVLRDPAQVAAHWDDAGAIDPDRLRHRAAPAWWDLLQRLGITLLVTREYEHLVIALSAPEGRPTASYMRLPHPSGLCVDRQSGEVHVAATRNPNQVFTLGPASAGPGEDRVLMPRRTTFYPGSLYLHDLAMVGGRLHGNAVGENAVVELLPDGRHPRRWWPASIESGAGPDFLVNRLQLNSIAAGADLEGSFFSASAAEPGRRRPGQLSFPVDRTGVIFSGRTRKPCATGLTRPHSARLHDGDLWVDDSGYGRVGKVEDGRFLEVARLPGWTRGLCLLDDVMFVGTSRVIPRFRRYAPGVTRDSCGLHAVDLRSGEVIARLDWPAGSQIFAIDWYPNRPPVTLPFRPGHPATRLARSRRLFHRYRLGGNSID